MEQLLKILEDNARMSVEDIAAMLNKSPAEVAAMIDLARAQGIIKGYKTLVDWEKAGVNRVEAVIELNVSPKKSRGFDEIAATIAAFDEVESVLLMSGGYDLQLVIKGQTFQEISVFVAKRLSPLDDVLSTGGSLHAMEQLGALAGLTLGVKMPVLTWTDQLMPIKQSAPVMLTLFGGMGYTVLLFAGFLLLPGWRLGFAGYAACFAAANLLLCAVLHRWLRKKGAALFAAL